MNPDWNDLEAIMDTLFARTEKEMVRRAVQSAIEAQIVAGTLQGSVNDFFPSEDPKWDSNVTEQMGVVETISELGGLCDEKCNS